MLQMARILVVFLTVAVVVINVGHGVSTPAASSDEDLKARAEIYAAARDKFEERSKEDEDWNKIVDFLCEEKDHGDAYYECYDKCLVMSPLNFVS